MLGNRFRLKFFFTLVVFLVATASLYFQGGEESKSEETQGDERLDKRAYLTTIYKNQKVYEDAFTQVANQTPKKQGVLALVTSHHLLAAPLIAGSYSSIADEFERIILVSPDHFHSHFSEGNTAFTTTLRWDGIVGSISPDTEFIERISREANNLQTNDVPFLSEHGIYTEIPFLAHYFPNAGLAPLILKNDHNYSHFRDFGALLRRESDTPTLLVISSDFSHNASKQQAKERDEKSISVLKNLQNDDFEKLNNDCRACVALLAGFLGSTEYSFQLIENKDSTDFGGEDRDVTSYISGIFVSQKKFSDLSGRKVEILFGGDMQFDRYIRSVARKRGGTFIFDGLRSEFQKADLVVANLEGPITNHLSVSEASAEGSHDNYVFTFPPETATLLREENVSLVNIGNNHILNFQEDGVRQTKDFLETAGVGHFGSPLNGDTRYVIRDIRAVKIAFVNYNQFVPNGREKALADIAAAKGESDFLIVYAHWGKEYVEATPETKTLAHAFVDAGADLIIGSHPHVVQEREEYKGKMIYYSLGNLIFDQYFRPETQAGLMVRAEFDLADKKITTKAVPISLSSNGQTEIVTPDPE